MSLTCIIFSTQQKLFSLTGIIALFKSQSSPILKINNLILCKNKKISFNRRTLSNLEHINSLRTTFSKSYILLILLKITTCWTNVKKYISRILTFSEAEAINQLIPMKICLLLPVKITMFPLETRRFHLYPKKHSLLTYN